MSTTMAISWNGESCHVACVARVADMEILSNLIVLVESTSITRLQGLHIQCRKGVHGANSGTNK